MFLCLTKVDKSAETRRNLHTHTHTHTHTCNLLLSPKQIGTICFAISILISVPLFAACSPDLNGSCPDCVNSNLQTYSGTSNLQANWQANTIQLHWYNGDDEIQNVPSESQSCVYDGTLTPPTTIPTKTGYTFKGWRVRIDPTCGLSSVDTTINGTLHVSKDYSGACSRSHSGEEALSLCSITQNWEWQVKFSYGTVKGTSKCSNTIGTYATVGNPSDTNGKYCWCSVTNYTPDGGSACAVASPSWVGYSEFTSANYCRVDCSTVCATRVYDTDAFRRAVFGVAGN